MEEGGGGRRGGWLSEGAVESGEARRERHGATSPGTGRGRPRGSVSGEEAATRCRRRGSARAESGGGGGGGGEGGGRPFGWSAF